jgi:CRISPR system Cascade subunit CasE
LYITNIYINQKDIISRLRNPYNWHALIWQLFFDRLSNIREFVFKVDQNNIILLSQQPPKLLPWGIFEIKKVPEDFLLHDQYMFSLRANPTIKCVVRLETGERKKNGRRVSIYKTDELIDWLNGKAHDSGFCVESVDVGHPVQQFFRKNGKLGKHISVDFSGILNIMDKDAFVSAFKKGIGSAKAFGFGMLILQKNGGK